MEEIYLDHAATSFPKAPGVGEAVAEFIANRAVNIGRGSYDSAVRGTLAVLAVRQAVCRLLGFGGDARQCAFSSGVTMSLNQLLQGAVQPGQHMLVGAMEHNAVARTAALLKSRGVEVDIVPCDAQGRVSPAAFERLIRGNTVLAAVQHASNVCGTIQNLPVFGEICQKHGIFLAVDAAQSAGHLPLQMDAWGLSAVAFSGHKGLLGPQGVGGAVIAPALSDHLAPIFAGGTGTESDRLTMPTRMPERLEAGTLNLPGICGLGAALCHLERVGIENIRAHERSLTARFLEALGDNPRQTLPGTDADGRVGVVLVRFLRRDGGEAADLLEREYGILTRCGLHCAPLAHRTLGTYPGGGVRFSFGLTSTEAQVDAAIRAVLDIC